MTAQQLPPDALLQAIAIIEMDAEGDPISLAAKVVLSALRAAQSDIAELAAWRKFGGVQGLTPGKFFEDGETYILDSIQALGPQPPPQPSRDAHTKLLALHKKDES